MREYISSFHKWTKKQRVNWSLCQRTHYYPAQPVEIQRLEKKKGTNILLSEEKEIGLGEINLPCTAVVILGPETRWSWNLSKLGQAVVRSTYLASTSCQMRQLITRCHWKISFFLFQRIFLCSTIYWGRENSNAYGWLTHAGSCQKKSFNCLNLNCHLVLGLGIYQEISPSCIKLVCEIVTAN